MNLPKNEFTFNLDVEGDITKETFKGSFTSVAVLNINQKRLLEAEKSRLSMDLKNPTDELSLYSSVLAELRVKIIDSPKWWKDSDFGGALLDENILLEVYKNIKEGENKWIEALREQGVEASKKQKEKKD